MGPNIKFLPGSYWDFWDHFLCLTEMSLGEALENNGYRVTVSHARFLPYSMVAAPRYPMALLRLYLALPILWRVFGKQFLVVAEKGIGKCSPIDDYRVQKRGGKGIITIHRTEKTGDAVSIMEVLPED